ncbi:MAG: glycoside hydrolase family 3 C-terminal domain-containing protein [Bacteroidetes bacterium]|nr:glycoside hydrolase family 3 C-terminal domain-containing protein [Bacteroidota bacterium]
MKKILFIALAAVLVLGFQNNEKSVLYKDAKAPVNDRVEDLLKRMTLDEKVAQLECMWETKRNFCDAKNNFDPKKAALVLVNGIGQIGRPSEGKNAYETAVFSNAIQKFLIEKTRLGIPAMFHEECLHGHAAIDATSFSQPIGLASTWNTQLIHDVFTLTAKEARARGTHQALSPVLDVAREPRWGRVEETYGEDPYLVKEMAVTAVKAFQGNLSNGLDNEHVFSTLKHFVAHGQPENGTNCGPVNVSNRVLREVFMYPFQKAIEAGAESVMASYNEVDAVPSHANKWLLTDVLRNEWGFKGVVVSDYYGIQELNNRHHLTADTLKMAELAISAGVTMELPEPAVYPKLKELVKKGLLSEKVLDDKVRLVLRHKFLSGAFDHPYVDAKKAQEIVGSAEGDVLSLKAAEETMVLLKNENSLAPLDVKKYKSIAVIGPNAKDTLLGGYSGVPKHFVTVYDGVKKLVGSDAKVEYAEGCKITLPGRWEDDKVQLNSYENDEKLINEAIAVAQKSDVIILAIGGNEQTSREAWSDTHMGDRSHLELLGRQMDLVKALEKTGKPIVVLLFNGSPICINYISEHIPTIFECWYLGQESGTAVANVLFGKASPSGKLPISFPRSVGHIPSFYNYKPSARRGYLFDDVSPLYSFGYGLSYSTFELGAPVLSKSKITRNESVTVSVKVTNTGKFEAMEVVQLYVHDEEATVTRPIKELKAFKKILLKAGETKTVDFALNKEAFAYWNIDMKYVVDAGNFTIMTGTSSLDKDLKKVVLTVMD